MKAFFINISIFVQVMKSTNETFKNYVLRNNLAMLYNIAGQNPRHKFGYFGAVARSAKLMKSYKMNVATYGVYLAAATMSGRNICPNSKTCAAFCLVNSGNAKAEALGGRNTIQAARIRKTWAAFERRALILAIMTREIEKAINSVKEYNKTHRGKNARKFAARLNCTGDINPLFYSAGGVSILDIFPDVQFYDYTKVPGRYNSRVMTYKNYDLTFSYDGTNGETCEKVLKAGGRVAVVFDTLNEEGRPQLPKYFNGYPVTSGDNYDMRYIDPAGVIGLTYHKTAGDFNAAGEYVRPQSVFVVNEKDTRVIM